jgi:hypothetical protein
MNIKTTFATNILIILALFFVGRLNSQSLSYSGPNSFNINSNTLPTHLGESLIPTTERGPTGMTFGDNGNKIYFLGSSADLVVQYSLSTPYDYSTRGPIDDAFRVNNEETQAQDVAFNDDGTRMYILGNQGDDVTEYALSSAWNVSSATFTDTFDARAEIESFLGATNGDLLTGMSFNDDGSKLFIADRRSDDVFEFDLSTNYDVSTAGAVVNNLVISGENNVRAISFNDDGTELYVIGSSGDDVNTFPLSASYDLSSVGTSSNHALPGSPDNVPQALLIDNAGTTFWVAGSNDDEVKEYTLSTAFDFSSTISFVEATPFPTVERIPRGMVFNNDGTKIFIAGDSQNFVSEMELTTPYDISTSLLTATLSVNSEESNIRGLAFNNTGTTLYIIGTNGDEINGYDLSVAFDLSSTISTSSGSPWSISAEENNPTDLFFNNDGTKLYVLGNTGNDINQYSLSSAFNIADATTSNLDIAFPLNNSSGLIIDSAPQGMAFNSDGTKLYIAGNTGNDINEITLSNAYDLSSGTITNTATFSIASEEVTVTDITFNANGSNFYITGSGGDDMNAYQTKGNLVETSANNGTIDASNPLVITLTGDTFADADMDNLLDLTTEFTIGNLPAGLTPVFTLSSGDTVATLTFTGTATNNDSTDDVANLTFTFTDAAFTSSNAADVSLAVGHTNVLGIDFNFCLDEIVYESGTWTGGNNAGVPDDSANDLVKGMNVRENVTITADVNCDCLQVDSGVTLTVADGIKLEVTNLVQLEGDIRLDGDAQLLQTFSGARNESGSGTLSVDQTSATTNIYQSGYWTAPVTTNGSTFTIAGAMKDGTTSTPLDINFTDIHTLDGDGTTTPITISGRWLAKWANSTEWLRFFDPAVLTFNPGEGYNMKGTGGIDGSSTQNYTFVGIPSAGDYNLTIDDERLYLLGNPYPSALDGDQFLSDNAAAIGGTLYFYESGTEMTHLSVDYNGGYATYNGITGVPFGAGKTPGRYVPIAQGFFVERDVNNSLGTGSIGSSATITFNNAQRDFVVEGASSVFFSRSSSNDPIVKLGLSFDVESEKTFHRQIAVGFVGGTRFYENGFDSKTLYPEPTDFGFIVEEQSEPFAIIGIESFHVDAEIPLNVYLDVDRNLTFSVEEQTNLDGQSIYLIDYEEETYYPIHENPVQLEVDAGSYLNRFTITFKIPPSLSLGEEFLKDKVSIFHDDGLRQLVIKSETIAIENIEVYNLLGEKVLVFQNEPFTSQVKLSSENLSTAIYVVKVKTDQGTLHKKIIVR